MKATILVLAVCTAASAAPFSLAGKVVDEAGAPLGGVEVSMQGVTGFVTSGVQGEFLLAGEGNSVSVKPATRLTGLRMSVFSNTVEWAGAGPEATLDVFRTNGVVVGRNIPFVAGRAVLPPKAGMALILRVKHNGVVVADLQGAGTGALRQLASVGVLQLKRAGFRTDTLSVDALIKTGIVKMLVASDPWIPTTLSKSGKMVKIVAAGKTFAMGENQIWDEFDNSEWPRHSVKFTRDFWMDTTEITQIQYESVMTASYPGYSGSIDWKSHFGMGADYPAYGVTAGGAILYCNALSKMEGLDTAYTYTTRDGESSHTSLKGAVVDLSKSGYRLPTEAEWEYAARAGTTTDFPWGSMSLQTASIADQMNANAIWAGNSYDLGDASPDFGTHPVASRLPNAYGLYDMLGSQSEWCWDDHKFEPYKAGQAIDPYTAPDPEMATAEHQSLAKRGGHWANSPNYLRVSNRTFETRAYFSYNEGFRTVRSVVP
ncbi:MAG: SUMF1/EgtB/PvdO family nonheme iron enzyme [Fibrobacteres bacterium]|nr:SUMF1/EgtB/PvdO family nonheme iron enzyme [Fibrobacterota bacterium]